MLSIPSGLVDPWACPSPPDRRYSFRWVDGVVAVYRSEGDAASGRPLPYRTVKFKQYVDDMGKLSDMVADGPLLVDSFPLHQYAMYEFYHFTNEIHSTVHSYDSF